MHHSVPIDEFKLELQSGNAKFASKSVIFFVPCDPTIWQMTLKNNRAAVLCYFKLCASFRSHLWIKSAVMVRKNSNWGKRCFDLCDLDLLSLTFTFCMEFTFNHGKRFENLMMIRWQEHREEAWQTDGRTDRWTSRRKGPFIELLGRS